MASNPFKKAEKTKARLRLALFGVSGSGKTMSALAIAQAFGKVAVIDTEHGSASKYAGLFTFDVLELTNYDPKQYIEAIQAAGNADYDVLVIDSLSHAWNGIGGVLEMVDKAASKSDSKNTYTAWRDATPLQQKLIEAILAAPMHVIVTMRSKTEYILEPDKRTGKMSPRKVGTTPIQREGVEYEFDVVAEMDMDNAFTVTKTRIPELTGQTIPHPTIALGEQMKAWLSEGIDAPPKPAPAPAEAPPNSVRGAGITPVAKPAQSQEETPVLRQHPQSPDDEPMNLYHCNRLIINQTRTATQYILGITGNAGSGIPVLDVGMLADLEVNGVKVPELPVKTHALDPSWSVYADREPNGNWVIEKIVTAIPV